MEVWADRLYACWQALWQRLSWQMLFVFGAGVFLWRTILLPMVADDYSYAFIWDGANAGNLMDGIGPRERINSLQDIFTSQLSHYFTWGGRVPALFAAQFFIWQSGEHGYLFDVFNFLFFILLVLVLFWLAAGRIESPGRSKAGLCWLLLGLFFALPSYIYTMLWMTGACVYLWTSVVVCAFLLPYARSFAHGDFWQDKGWGCVISLFVLGLWAGWSMETVSMAAVFLTLAFLLLAYRQKKLRRWQVAGFCGLVMGALLLMLAPGNMERVRLMEELAPDYTMPPELLWTPVMFLYNFVEGFLPVFTGELPLLVPILLCLRYDLGSREEKRYMGLFTAASFLILAAMMFSPDFRAHGAYHSVIFLLVASTKALRIMLPWGAKKCAQFAKLRLGMAVLGFSTLGLWLAATVICLIIETSYSQQWAAREQLIAQHRQDDPVVVPAIEIPWRLDKITGSRSVTETLLMFGGDLESNPKDNRSNVYAQYHGLKGIVIDKKIDWGKYGEANDW